MSRPSLFPSLVVVSAVCVLGSVGWKISQADNKEAAKQPPASKVTETLGGTDRYLTHLSTDKPMYRKAAMWE